MNVNAHKTEDLSKKSKLLFICSYGFARSRTAAELFQKEHPDIEIKHCGIKSNICWPAWIQKADTIIVFENWHEKYLKNQLKENVAQKAIVNLHIPDQYSYNQPELISILKRKLQKLNIDES